MEEMQVQKKDFLNTYEVAGRMGVSPATLRAWRSTGKGPRFYKFHRSVFYRADDIDAWIQENYRLVEPER